MRSPANPQRFSLLVVLAVAAISALSGCYTVLKHPRTELVRDGGERRRDCYDCHGGNGPAFAYNPMVVEGFDYYDDSWYPWYAYPWWYRDFWYNDQYHHRGDPSGGIGGGAPVDSDNDSDRRHLWGRGPYWTPLPSLPPVVSSPVAGGGSVPPNPGSTLPAEDRDENHSGRVYKSGSSAGNSGGNQSQGQTGGSTPKDGDSKKEKKDKNEKDGERHYGGRGRSKGGGQ